MSLASNIITINTLYLCITKQTIPCKFWFISHVYVTLKVVSIYSHTHTLAIKIYTFFIYIHDLLLSISKNKNHSLSRSSKIAHLKFFEFWCRVMKATKNRNLILTSQWRFQFSHPLETDSTRFSLKVALLQKNPFRLGFFEFSYFRRYFEV